MRPSRRSRCASSHEQVGLIRRRGERAVETRLRFGRAARAREQARQRERRGREPGMERERAFERVAREVVAAEIEQQRAEVVVGERIVGIEPSASR